ncbi:Threonyl/alanyl tRNA synthetase [Lasiosphaeria miniovina]|uniref:Threonyl/alanyl tRNA synthetase n=1 Tax=Lasiosphaeria miniovina TaxID=1954250 RepID=A0AA40BGH6_9PEZI|nr:Threonyl/alanyl tRNA synthetase [Lasiosphaeria miniovina]KAK0733800.1 Threonyl/alanyl tRNA synthetase [Lasiosphaeria miniovina]
MGITAARTFLAFHHNAKLYKLQTVVTAVKPFAALEEANRLLFKQGTDEDFAVVTEQTIFHPQGGGQPSDEGTISSPPSSAGEEATPSIFRVSAARTDAVHDGQVLHFGRFDAGPSGGPPQAFAAGTAVEQAIDVEKRVYYSRLHTAGHVLGAAVRHLLEGEVAGFDELKASHFPDSASCEFKGLVDGKWKEPIQRRLDEYVARAMPVEIEFWDDADFIKNGLERLIPDKSLAAPGEKFRVVRIVGAETYPCGGTHVDTTDLCGEATVKKISRSKGISRVSYAVAL